jgi:hypothetical protein
MFFFHLNPVSGHFTLSIRLRTLRRAFADRGDAGDTRSQSARQFIALFKMIALSLKR